MLHPCQNAASYPIAVVDSLLECSDSMLHSHTIAVIVGVTGCLTGHYVKNGFMQNSSLAEQKNSMLRRLESQVAYMNQTTFLWYLRYFLYRLNKDGRRFWSKRA